MPRGLFGRRYVDQPNWIAHLLDPFARDMTPAENPYGRSAGNVAFGNSYTPPTYGDDIQASGVARQPLSSLLTNAPPPEAPPMQPHTTSSQTHLKAQAKSNRTRRRSETQSRTHRPTVANGRIIRTPTRNGAQIASALIAPATRTHRAHPMMQSHHVLKKAIATMEPMMTKPVFKERSRG